MAQCSSSNAPLTEDDDSEWEYEYHDTETESFYVVLDISSASNNLRPKRNPDAAIQEPMPSVSKPGATGSVGDIAAANDPFQAGAASPSEVDQIVPEGPGQHEAGQAPQPEERVQILDFHSANPIISFQNQIYSCEWTSTVGTDLLLTPPDPGFPHPVLREASGVSVLAATSIKLYGRPVQILSRLNANGATTPQDQPSAAESPSQAIETPSANRRTSVEIPLGLAPSRARQKQASFLERLIAVKAAKGEKDHVTVYAQKTQQGSGWRSQQRRAAERRTSEGGENASGGESTATTSLRGTGRIGRPKRGSWRTTGPRTAKGGLFRDYRPQIFDTEGAGIRNDSKKTPESWAQLEHAEASGHYSAPDMIASSSATPTEQDSVSNISSIAPEAPETREPNPPVVPTSQLQHEVQPGLPTSNRIGANDGIVEAVEDVEMAEAGDTS